MDTITIPLKCSTQAEILRRFFCPPYPLSIELGIAWYPSGGERDAGCCRAQSTYIFRAPQCMSPRRNWDSPQPLSRKRVCPPPPDQRVGGHPRLRLRGWGSSNSDDWRKSLALCLLCAAGLPRNGNHYIRASLSLSTIVM